MKINYKYIIVILLILIVPTGTFWAVGYLAKKKLDEAKKTPDSDNSTIPDSDGSNDYNSENDNNLA
jgi:hypothetical protein